MRVLVNGAPREIARETTLDALLRDLAVDPRRVAVAVNAAVVPRPEYPGRVLAEGDAIEVIEPVGGG